MVVNGSWEAESAMIVETRMLELRIFWIFLEIFITRSVALKESRRLLKF